MTDTFKMIEDTLNEVLAFVEMIERREDTHYLIGGKITDALAALKARHTQAGDER